MRQFKRLVFFVLACCLLLVGALGCDQSLEQRLDAAYKRLGEATNYQATVVLGIMMNVSSQGTDIPVPLLISLEMTAFTDPMEIKCEAWIKTYGVSQKITELYVQELKDGSGVMYIFEPIEGTWLNTKISPRDMADYYESDVSYASFSKLFTSPQIVDSESIDGIETDVIETKLDVDAIWESYMGEIESDENASLWDEEADVFLDGMKSVLKTVSCRIWFSKQSTDLLKIKLDLSGFTDLINEALGDDMMQSLLGELAMEDMPQDMEINISDLYIEITYKNLNQAEPYEIPPDVFGYGTV